MNRISKFVVVVVVFLMTSAISSAQDTEGFLDVSTDRSITVIKLSDYNPPDAGSYVAEISAFDTQTKTLCISDGTSPVVRLIDLTDLENPKLKKLVELGEYSETNSVACHGGIFAIAVNNKDHQKEGYVVFIKADGEKQNVLQVGAMPDMVTFTPDGRYLLVANEGEPNDAYTVDPEGSIAIISISGDIGELTASDVRYVRFASYSRERLPQYVRVVHPTNPPTQDFEPEYIAISPDGGTALVSLQENNAIAVIDIESAEIKALHGLPWKDHSKAENAFDASDKDDAIAIKTWPVWGIPMPDTIACFEQEGELYVVTANEGDAKDYSGFSEEKRVSELKLNGEIFKNAGELQNKRNLGRLKTSIVGGEGRIPENGMYDKIFSYGTRSFTIYKISQRGLEQVFDSGSFFERHMAKASPENFNSNNDENNSFDSRSDDKGPEPEALTVGQIGNRRMLFVGMERNGGIYAFDISNPYSPEFAGAWFARDFASHLKGHGMEPHMGPEGMLLISASDSPDGKPVLVVSYEVSGSVVLYGIREGINQSHQDEKQ